MKQYKKKNKKSIAIKEDKIKYIYNDNIRCPKCKEIGMLYIRAMEYNYYNIDKIVKRTNDIDYSHIDWGDCTDNEITESIIICNNCYSQFFEEEIIKENFKNN